MAATTRLSNGHGQLVVAPHTNLSLAALAEVKGATKRRLAFSQSFQPLEPKSPLASIDGNHVQVRNSVVLTNKACWKPASIHWFYESQAWADHNFEGFICPSLVHSDHGQKQKRLDLMHHVLIARPKKRGGTLPFVARVPEVKGGREFRWDTKDCIC